MWCHHQEEGAEEGLGRVAGPTTSFGRGSKTQADPRLCTLMTLSQQKVKKLSRKMEFPLQSGHSKCHRRSLLEVDFQAIEDGVPSTVRIGFSLHLLQKETTVVGKELEALVGVLRILLEELTVKAVEARAILTGAPFRHYGHSVLQATAQVLVTVLPEAEGGLDLPGQVQIVAVEAPEESLLVEAVAEVVTCGLLHDKRTLRTS